MESQNTALVVFNKLLESFSGLLKSGTLKARKHVMGIIGSAFAIDAGTVTDDDLPFPSHFDAQFFKAGVEVPPGVICKAIAIFADGIP